MKKIPKFDQKAWDEKQAKSAENYSRGEKDSGPTSVGFLDAMKSILDKRERELIYGMPVLKVPKDKLAAQYPPSSGSAVFGSRIGTAATTRYNPATERWILIGDDYDQHLLSGDSEDTMELPSGYDHLGQGWIKPDPAFEAAEKCCTPEHRTNIGFHMDKWACKKCGKDML